MQSNEKAVVIAKRLYRQGQYEKAHRILRRVKTQPARKLKQQIEDEVRVERLEGDIPMPDKASTSRRFGMLRGRLADVPAVALFVLVVNLLAWVVGITVAVAAADPLIAGTALLVLVIGAVVYIPASYLVWRLYWWFLALVWTLATLLLLSGIMDIIGIALSSE